MSVRLAIFFVFFGFVSCKAQVPRSQTYIQKYAHDFNDDGIKDQIIVYEDTMEKDQEDKKPTKLSIHLYEGKKHGTSWGKNDKIISGLGPNCPLEGFQTITINGRSFTVKQSFCHGMILVKAWTTFQYEKKNNKFYLTKYKEKYVNRQQPDKKIPAKTWTEKDFGKIPFSKVSAQKFYKYFFEYPSIDDS